MFNDFPFWLIPLCLLVGFLFAGLLYFKERKSKELQLGIRISLFLLRTLSIAFLVLYLFNPLLRNVSTEKEKPIVLIAHDNSSSLLMNKDSIFLKSDYLKTLYGFRQDLIRQYDVRFYRFDSEVVLNDTLNFLGKETDMMNVLKEISNNYSGRNVGALIIAGDGLYNKGANPAYQTEGLSFPIYTLALGDTTPIRDLMIRKVDHNQVAYLGNKFPVEVLIDSKLLKDKSATISISKDGKEITSQKFTIRSERFFDRYSFVLDADNPGIQKYRVQLTVFSEEQNKKNNSLSFIVDVIDNREKVLLLSGAPHPDAGAIKESIETNKNYEVESEFIENFKSSLKPFSLVILCQVNLSSAEGQRIMNELNASSQPYLLVGPSSFQKIPGISIFGGSQKTNDAEAVLDKGFSLFTLSDKLRAYSKDLPAIKAPLGNYSVTNSVSALFNQKIGTVETEQPLFYFNTQNGNQKCGVIIGDGIWKWKMRDFAEHNSHELFNEIINKTVQYLSVKADKRFFRIYHKKLFNENEAVEMNAEVYNNSYELITEPEVNITILNESGKQFSYAFTKQNNAYYLKAGQFPPGEYKYIARVSINNQPFETKGIFTVKELELEQLNTVADHKTLQLLSSKTGGKMFYPNEWNKVKEDLMKNENIKTITYTHQQLNDLIDVKWILIILLGVLALEWFLRKRNGLY